MTRSLKKGQAMKKKVKKTSQPKKAPKSSKPIESITSKLFELLIDSSEEEDEGLPLMEVKEEVQSFFDFRKDIENLVIKKKVKRVVFMGGDIRATNYHLLHHMIPNTSKGC